AEEGSSPRHARRRHGLLSRTIGSLATLARSLRGRAFRIRRSVQALAELRCETRKMAFCSGGVVNPGIVMEHPAMRAAVEVLMHRLDARLHQGFDEKSGLLRRITGVLVGCPD